MKCMARARCSAGSAMQIYEVPIICAGVNPECIYVGIRCVIVLRPTSQPSEAPYSI